MTDIKDNRRSSELEEAENLLFQSEMHPLVSENPRTCGEFILSLIHEKAYAHARRLARGAKVLDLGCNDGYGTFGLAAVAAEVIGLDVSRRAIMAARNLRKRDNLEFQLCDGNVLPFREHSFDLITSFQVIEHLHEVRRYLDEIKRVLKPTGKALFTTPNRLIRLDPGMKPWNPFHVREYTAEDLQNTLLEVFPRTTVSGLLAQRDIYQIEYHRCQQALAYARAGTSSSRGSRASTHGMSTAMSRFKAMVFASGVARLRALTHSAFGEGVSDHEQPLTEFFMNRWTIADFYYVDDPNEICHALDLMAECSV